MKNSVKMKEPGNPADNLAETLKDIEKMFGLGAVMKLGDRSKVDVKVISTGSLSLDVALGVGGYPAGRIVEIYGPESSGKTTLALHAIAECQKSGGRAAFIDAEHAIDPTYAKKLGVNIDELILSQPSSGEEGLEIADMLVKSGAVSMIVIDSVPALVPKSELEGEMVEATMGAQARMMSKALRKLTGNIARNDCIIIFINQLREKLGIVYGTPETTPGGRALKFYSTIRIDVRRGDPLKISSDIVGNQMRLKIVKNKVSAPFKTCTVDLVYGQGISYEGDLIELASETGIVKRIGSWYDYQGEKIGQGKDNARLFLKENTGIRDKIAAEVLKRLGK